PFAQREGKKQAGQQQRERAAQYKIAALPVSLDKIASAKQVVCQRSRKNQQRKHDSLIQKYLPLGQQRHPEQNYNQGCPSNNDPLNRKLEIKQRHKRGRAQGPEHRGNGVSAATVFCFGVRGARLRELLVHKKVDRHQWQDGVGARAPKMSWVAGRQVYEKDSREAGQ